MASTIPLIQPAAYCSTNRDSSRAFDSFAMAEAGEWKTLIPPHLLKDIWMTLVAGIVAVPTL